MAANACSPCLLVTANVGSIFEDPQVMLKIWLAEFTRMIRKSQPLFLALHCQEVGGKQYEESMKHVEEFVRILMSSPEMMPFDRVRVFLDEDFLVADKFTALGSFYFIHEDIKAVQIWDFKAMTFVPVIGKEVHSGNIENVTTKEKAKFSPDLFPDCKWSRKGFLRTRWYLNGSIFDLVNIHLFHDASNFIAMESFPSVYSGYRRRAMSSVFDRFRDDANENVPFFIFGDFNFRLNTQGVVTRLTQKTVAHHVKSTQNGETSKIMYMEPDNANKVILTLGKKEFDHHDQHNLLTVDGGMWMREFDLELTPFADKIFEYEITFPPSYPFAENVSCGKSYMKTRCPAWCDRILLSKNALPLVYSNPEDLDNSQVDYHVIGQDVCMGDHKPVYLFFHLVWSAGTHFDSSPLFPPRNVLSGQSSFEFGTVSSPTSSTSYITARSGDRDTLTNGSVTPTDGGDGDTVVKDSPTQLAPAVAATHSWAFTDGGGVVACRAGEPDSSSTPWVTPSPPSYNNNPLPAVATLVAAEGAAVHDAACCRCCHSWCSLL